jgi:hypothetical protein
MFPADWELGPLRRGQNDRPERYHLPSGSTRTALSREREQEARVLLPVRPEQVAIASDRDPVRLAGVRSSGFVRHKQAVDRTRAFERGRHSCAHGRPRTSRAPVSASRPRICLPQSRAAAAADPPALPPEHPTAAQAPRQDFRPKPFHRRPLTATLCSMLSIPEKAEAIYFQGERDAQMTRGCSEL